MSNEWVQVGVMGVVLDRSVYDEKYYDEDEPYLDKDETLSFNYKGTLAYMLLKDVEVYDFNSEFVDIDKLASLKHEMLSKFEKYGVALDFANYKIKFFVNKWYDGCDNPINTMSIEDFVKS